MIKRVLQLIKIARKLASSGALDTINQIYKIPLTLKIFFDLVSIGSQKKILSHSKSSGEKLCDALEGMGTTFIKLGQFLATRPDIIGNELANDLEKLQDKNFFIADRILAKHDENYMPPELKEIMGTNVK